MSFSISMRCKKFDFPEKLFLQIRQKYLYHVLQFSQIKQKLSSGIHLMGKIGKNRKIRQTHDKFCDVLRYTIMTWDFTIPPVSLKNIWNSDPGTAMVLWSRGEVFQEKQINCLTKQRSLIVCYHLSLTCYITRKMPCLWVSKKHFADLKVTVVFI